MTHRWNGTLPQSVGFNFKEASISDDWFTIYEIAANLFVFYEPRHYEETLATLIIGREKAALIDTGCGIGDLCMAVKAVTDKPIVVINTHTHTDHIGSNHQFGDVAMFDHPLAHRVAETGVSEQIMQNDILVMSYRTLMEYYDDFDHLMPSHNEPWLGKQLLPASLAGAEQVIAGQAAYREIADPWNRQLRQYSFDQFSILTPQQETL